MVCLFVCFVCLFCLFFFFNDTATTEIYTLSLHDALPISAHSRDLRKSPLQRDTIASEPVNGWRWNIRYSLAALEWLEYRGEQLGRPLQHVGNIGEHPVCDGSRTYHADGYDPDTHTLYEFYGCFWHGCLDCYPQARYEPHQQLQGRTLEEVYRATLYRQNRVNSLGYRLEKI